MMRRVPSLKHLLVASASVLVVMTGFMLWSHLDYGDGFPDLHQFRIYSASAFVATIVLLSILLERGAGHLRALSILLVSGFAIFLAVGIWRFLVGEGDENWRQALSGPSSLATSLVVNGGFLSIVAVSSYVLARAVISLLSAMKHGSSRSS